jgi:uncharacterized protein (TIGR03083 family)
LTLGAQAMQRALSEARARTLGMPSFSYDDMLFWIADRSDTLRSSAAATDLTARVPGCPDWSVEDLVGHLGAVHLFWAAAVFAGPSDGPPDSEAVGDQAPQGDLFEWSADAADKLLTALRGAPPGRGCWTWWDSSGAPMTAGAVARHQVQEAGVHAFDAQQAAGTSASLPAAVAADGVGEYLTVGLASMGAWPHNPASIRLETGAGGSWLVELGPGGTKVSETPAWSDCAPQATVTADPADMVLAFYRRTPYELRIDGDADAVARLLEWPDLD